MVKGGSSDKSHSIVLSSEQKAMLRRLISEGQGKVAARKTAGQAAAKAGTGDSIVLSPEEMTLLRRLSGLSPRPAGRTRTADLSVTQDEMDLLRRMADPAGPAAKPKPRRTTDIVLTQEELRFLSALSGKEVQAPARRVRTLQERLAAEAAEGDPQTPVLLSLTPPEAEWLNMITRDGYSFITPGERRARLILREKLHAAMARAPGGESAPPKKDEPAR